MVGPGGGGVGGAAMTCGLYVAFISRGGTIRPCRGLTIIGAMVLARLADMERIIL